MVIILISQNAYSGWQPQIENISIAWGEGDVQLSFEEGDTENRWPFLDAVLNDGKLVFTDLINKRYIVLNNDGSLFKSINWYFYENGEKRKNLDITYRYSNTQGFMTDGSIWSNVGKTFFLTSADGQQLQSIKQRPVELGVISTKYISSSKKLIVIQYPDQTFTVDMQGRYVRDLLNYVNVMSGKRVRKYDSCGKVLGEMTVPDNEYNIIRPAGDGFERVVETIAEYGDPVIAPNGDIYAAKRTQEALIVLKWVWQADPNVDAGPNVPEEVQALPSTSGIYITWNPAPQDPGCVTGYEIERAASANGSFTNLTTVPLTEDRTYNYNDTTATAGATWYYRISAKSDIGNSDPVEVSATRP